MLIKKHNRKKKPPKQLTTHLPIWLSSPDASSPSRQSNYHLPLWLESPHFSPLKQSTPRQDNPPPPIIGLSLTYEHNTPPGYKSSGYHPPRERGQVQAQVCKQEPEQEPEHRQVCRQAQEPPVQFCKPLPERPTDFPIS